MTILRPFLLLGLFLFSLVLPVHSQERDEEPQEMFRWSMTTDDLGEVSLPASGGGGWSYGPNGLMYRSVPSFSGDPTFEVLVRAPHSGNPLYPERLLIQIPPNFNSQPFAERAVVVGFHSFSVSEKDVFLNTALPYEAKQRGWMLVAPYGLTDTSFGNTQAQASFQAIAHSLFAVVPFNYRRVYGVGFSMGGISALSFAMRHTDPLQLQFAGVVIHTATLDMVQTYQNSNLARQLLLADSKHFGGTPSNARFEYERVSPVGFQSSGLVNPNLAPVVNFESRGIYLHTNLADPNTTLVAGMSSLGQFLQQRGANVYEDLVYEPALGHSWTSMNMTAALDYIELFDLEASPPSPQEFFADNPGRWMHTDVESVSMHAFGRYRLELAPFSLGTLNSFALQGTRDLDEITLDIQKLGLDGTQPLIFTHSAGDGTIDWINLVGFDVKPTTVKAAGGPPATWNYNSTSKVLSIVPTTTGTEVQVVVTP
jgi:predicted esterase